MTVRDQAIAAGKAAQETEAVKAQKPPCEGHKWTYLDLNTRQCDNCRIVQARPSNPLYSMSEADIVEEAEWEDCYVTDNR